VNGSVKRWGNRMPCEVVEDGTEWGIRCGALTVFTTTDEHGSVKRICRAHIEEQREAATA